MVKPISMVIASSCYNDGSLSVGIIRSNCILYSSTFSFTHARKGVYEFCKMFILLFTHPSVRLLASMLAISTLLKLQTFKLECIYSVTAFNDTASGLNEGRGKSEYTFSGFSETMVVEVLESWNTECIIYWFEQIVGVANRKLYLSAFNVWMSMLQSVVDEKVFKIFTFFISSQHLSGISIFDCLNKYYIHIYGIYTLHIFMLHFTLFFMICNTFFMNFHKKYCSLFL